MVATRSSRPVLRPSQAGLMHSTVCVEAELWKKGHLLLVLSHPQSAVDQQVSGWSDDKMK